MVLLTHMVSECWKNCECRGREVRDHDLPELPGSLGTSLDLIQMHIELTISFTGKLIEVK
jgi:hypothetical protein